MISKKTKRIILFSIAYLSILVFLNDVSIARRPPARMRDCCPNLEYDCDKKPCRDSADCFRQDTCVKHIDKHKFPCRLKNPEKYIEDVNKSSEFSNFIRHENVHLFKIYLDEGWTNSRCSITLRAVFEIQHEQFVYSTSPLYILLQDRVYKPFKQGMEYHHILSAIHAAKKNYNVSLWLQKHPHRMVGHIDFDRYIQVSFWNPKPEFAHIEWPKGGGMRPGSYGNTSRIAYSYEFAHDRGSLVRIEGDLSDLVYFEHANILMGDRRFKEFVGNSEMKKIVFKASIDPFKTEEWYINLTLKDRRYYARAKVNLKTKEVVTFRRLSATGLPNTNPPVISSLAREKTP